MARSDDNDKTQIQHRNQADDDKTRIAPRKPMNAEERAEMEEQRKRLAAQKARELEQRLAAIAAKKKQQAQMESESGEADDRTRIQAPRTNAANPKNPKNVEENSAGDDKTVFKPRPTPAADSGDKTQIKPRTETSDKTQIQYPPRQLENDDGDKTQFKPRPTAATQDQTHIQGERKSTPPPLDEPPSDATQFKPATRDPAQTVISEVDLPPGTPLETTRDDSFQRMLSGQELLKNRFLLEKVLGAGGMGMVYKAKDLLKVEAQDKDPYVAIKVLNDEFKSHPDAFIALQRESRKTQRIAHPNIVNVHDFDKDGDSVFMTMEFLDGKPLDKFISQYRTTGLPEEDCWNILQGICAALVYAHGEHIIHSDFKPGNIFVTNKGIPKVFDFGIARAVAKAEKFEDSLDDKTVFDAGNLGALTPAYASLEMLEGEPPDVRDDIYALGCIAYEMFTGKHPFNRTHATEAMKQKLKPVRIPNITKHQWKVIEKALAFKREDRVPTVEEFWNQISRKRSSNILAISVSLLVVGLVSFLVYQNYFVPKGNEFSEDEFRSELELKLRLEQYQQNLTQLLETQEFDTTWENRVWTAVQALRKLMGEDPWLQNNERLIYQAYITRIKALIEQENFADAKALRANAERFAKDKTELLALDKLILEGEKALAKRIKEQEEKERLARIEKQKTAVVAEKQKEINDAYLVALDTVNKQLACRTSLNMGDLTIAVEKLRSLDAARYRKGEEEMVEKLAGCISKIGVSFPDRAEEFKKRALRLFPDNKKIAYVKIEPKDPCDTSLAGLGARGSRAICRDRLKNKTDDFGKGPSMVVVPGKGSIGAFAIGKYEVTVEDLNKYCESTKKCKVDRENSHLPVTNIPVGVAQSYLQWLSDISGYTYRLPTKAEWVYAARAESARLDSNRNCLLNSRGIQKGGMLVKSSIGQQNDWGLVNHVGNAREWVRDGGGFLALGGSFETSMEECSVTKTESHNGSADNMTGFRVFREISKRRDA